MVLYCYKCIKIKVRLFSIEMFKLCLTDINFDIIIVIIIIIIIIIMMMMMITIITSTYCMYICMHVCMYVCMCLYIIYFCLKLGLECSIRGQCRLLNIELRLDQVVHGLLQSTPDQLG